MGCWADRSTTARYKRTVVTAVDCPFVVTAIRGMDANDSGTDVAVQQLMASSTVPARD